MFPPVISQPKKLITSPTSLITAKFNHQLKKKVAIVTPEQRTKKCLPDTIPESLKINQDKNTPMPTFSSKQLLSSMIRNRTERSNEKFELNDYQVFSIDCKKAVQVLSNLNTCLNNNNNKEVNSNVDFVGKVDNTYKCLECEEGWQISNQNINNIISHFSPKWSNNCLEENYSPKKHIGKLFDQRQALVKWSIYQKQSNAKTSTNITMLTIIRCRKCKLYFPGSFENLNEKSTPIDMLLEHSYECHTKIVNEWKHHQSLSIKSLR